MAITKGEDYIATIATYLPFRAKLVQNIKIQILSNRKLILYDGLTKSRICKENAIIEAYVKVVDDSSMKVFRTENENRGFVHIFSGQKLHPKFRTIY